MTDTNVRAAPAARAKAQELGIDLSKVQGTGKGGYITVADVQAAAGQASAPTATEQPASAPQRPAPGLVSKAAGAKVAKTAEAAVKAAEEAVLEAMRAQERAQGRQKQTEPVYYIVNPRGVIHAANRAVARESLKKLGYRLATKAEIDAYIAANGRQEVGHPLAKPYSPEPPELPELPS